MPSLETEQGRLFFAGHGSGSPDLMCLHGAGGTHQHWGRQLQTLHALTRVIALDLPGHGRTPGPGRTSIADYSLVVLAALDALGLERVVLAGHSMGGAIALWTALATPERVAGLVLVATGARLPILPALLASFPHDPAAAVRLVVERAYGQAAAPELRRAGEAAFLQTDPQVFHGDLHACDVYDVRSRLHAISCPTLVLCGSDDQVTPARFSHSLQQQIAGATLVLVPDAGHMLMLEQPEAVNRALRQFWEDRKVGRLEGWRRED